MQRVTRFGGHVPLYFDDLDSGLYVLDIDPADRADKNSYSLHRQAQRRRGERFGLGLPAKCLRRRLTVARFRSAGIP